MESADSLNLNNNSIILNNVCSIKFFLILDNSGKRIYCRYYSTNEENSEFDTIENQLNFEKKLCKKILKLNVDRVDLDIINFEKNNILCKVNGEVNIFIGINEDDNEILLEKIYDEFEFLLFEIIQDNLIREKIFSCYDKIVILIDELVYGRIMLNIDRDSLLDRVFGEKVKYNNNKDNNIVTGNKNNEKKGNFITSWFGF